MRKLSRLLTVVLLPAVLLPSSVPYIAGASSVKTYEAYSVPANEKPAEKASIHSKDEVLEQIDRINQLRRADNYVYKGTDGAITWTIDRYGVLTLTGNGDYSNVTSDYSYPKWYPHRSSIKSAVVAITGIHSARKMFAGLNNLETVEITYFDTTSLTDTSHMFDGCKSMQGISFKTTPLMNVTDMSYMFNDCTNLTNLELDGWYTNNVTNMAYMFAGCKNLPDFELRFFNTSKVTNMSHMFYNCESFVSLHINDIGYTGFDTSNVTDMSYMFSGCINLRDFNISTTPLEFNTRKVTNMKGMFENCKVAAIDVSKFDTSNVADMSFMFAGCENLSAHTLGSLRTGKVTNMNSMFKECIVYSFLDVSNFDTSNVIDMGDMFNKCQCSVLNIGRFNTANVVNMHGMFSGCTAWNYDLANFNTSRVTDMGEMFNNCTNISVLDFSMFDMRSAGNVTRMFNGCTSMTFITAPANMARNVDLPVTNGYPWHDSFGRECRYMTGGQPVTTYFRNEAPTVPDMSTPAPTPSPTPKAFPTTTPKPTVTPSPSPAVTPVPTVTSSPSATPAPTKKPVETPPPDEQFTSEPGTIWQIGNAIYTVTENSGNVKSAEYSYALKSPVNLRIPDTVEIEGETFQVKAVASRALLRSNNVAKVIIGKNVETIGDGTFRECNVLQEVQIGKNVREIGSKCFYKSKLLRKITIKSSKIENISNKAFAGISSKAVIKVPKAKAAEYRNMIGRKYKYKKV